LPCPLPPRRPRMGLVGMADDPEQPDRPLLQPHAPRSERARRRACPVGEALARRQSHPRRSGSMSLRTWWSRIRGTFRRDDALEREMQREMDFHLEMAAKRNI